MMKLSLCLCVSVSLAVPALAHDQRPARALAEQILAEGCLMTPETRDGIVAAAGLTEAEADRAVVELAVTGAAFDDGGYVSLNAPDCVAAGREAEVSALVDAVIWITAQDDAAAAEWLAGEITGRGCVLPFIDTGALQDDMMAEFAARFAVPFNDPLVAASDPLYFTFFDVADAYLARGAAELEAAGRLTSDAEGYQLAGC